ncbi:MAG: hypothetical protein JWN23_2583 [Rhodocyclales bacterium]|nr:hypothetical protein [Rhodocyclales bacterium]
MRFELSDLDANDGITSTLTWISTSSQVQASRDFDQHIELVPQADGTFLWSVTYAQNEQLLDSSVVGAWDTTHAAVAGAVANTGFASVSAEASLLTGGASVLSLAYVSRSFVLSANTALHIFGNITTGASGSASEGFQGPGGASPDVGVSFSQAFSYAEVFLEANDVLWSLANGQNFTPSTDPSVYPMEAYLSDSVTSFDLAFRNESSDDALGGFYALAETSAEEIAPLPGASLPEASVPEPSSLALLFAAGLSSICLLVRKRQV